MRPVRRSTATPPTDRPIETVRAKSTAMICLRSRALLLAGKIVVTRSSQRFRGVEPLNEVQIAIPTRARMQALIAPSRSDPSSVPIIVIVAAQAKQAASGITSFITREERRFPEFSITTSLIALPRARLFERRIKPVGDPVR